MIRDARPVWTIIDSLTAYAPEIEEKASNVTRVYQEFRKIAHECGNAMTGIHHLRKPSSKPDEAPAPLEENPHRWFLQARGSRALVNGADVRIGIDRFSNGSQISSTNGHAKEVALVLGGFGRVRGNFATSYIARVLDADDEPMGYDKMSGVSLLFNSEQEEAYQKLPAIFRFKDAPDKFMGAALRPPLTF